MADGTEQPAASLGERVAALEECIRYPLRMYVPKWEPLTGAEEAELRESIAEAAKLPPRVIQMPPPLSRDEIRQLLRECVTVVKPGEVLIFRCTEGWTPIQAAEVGQCAAQWLEDNAPEVKILVMPDAEMAVMEPGADGGFDRHVAEAVNRLRLSADSAGHVSANVPEHP